MTRMWHAYRGDRIRGARQIDSRPGGFPIGLQSITRDVVASWWTLEIREPIDGGSAREGRLPGIASPFVGRNRARGRPTQSLPASRRVVRAHDRGLVRGLRARPGPTRSRRRRCAADPLALSAQRVYRWVGPDGYYYLYLSGKTSALQGVDGLRASKAVARIVPIAEGEEPLYQVDVFAEDDVPETRKKASSIPHHRARFGPRRLRWKPICRRAYLS